VFSGADNHGHRHGSGHRQGPGTRDGADDYITKPFSTHELASRVKSVLRWINSGETDTEIAVPTPSKFDMPFLHPKDEI